MYMNELVNFKKIDIIKEMIKEKMATDVKALVEDAEALLNESVVSAGEKAVELREKLRERLCEAMQKVIELEGNVVQKTKQAATAADDFVHEHPWKAIGIAAGVGMILGLLIGRR